MQKKCEITLFSNAVHMIFILFSLSWGLGFRPRPQSGGKGPACRRFGAQARVLRPENVKNIYEIIMEKK